MKSGSVGKVLPPKRMTMMGKVLKKRYTAKELVPSTPKKTPKTRKRTSQEHPEVTGDTISPCRVCGCCSHVCSSSRTGCLDPRSLWVDSQESGWNKNSANRHYHLKSGSFHKHFTNPKKLLENLDLKFKR